MRTEKTYNGRLMTIGKETEEAVLSWLRRTHPGKEVLDFREFRIAQRIDVDFGVETVDGRYVLAEIKSDKHIDEEKNFLFEHNRVNHYVDNHWFYLGWGWRSPAEKLIIRNPQTTKTFVFDFLFIRRFIGMYIARTGKKTRISIVETDNQKTTFNIIIPFTDIPRDLYKVFNVPAGHDPVTNNVNNL